MFRSICSSSRTFRPGGWGCVAVFAACLGLSGCRTLSYSDFDFSHVEGFPAAAEVDGASGLSSQRTRSLPHALTNEGMEIERNLGAR